MDDQFFENRFIRAKYQKENNSYVIASYRFMKTDSIVNMKN